MTISRFGLCRLFATWAILIGIAASAHAVGWSDDFNDGSVLDGTPVTWINDLGGSGLFQGDYNATSGDFVMTPIVDGVDSSIMISLVGTPFTDVYMRTQGYVIPDPLDPTVNKGGNLVLLARVDPAMLNGYLVYFDVSGNLNLQILAGGGTFDIGTTFDAPFNAGSEVVVQMDVVGDTLSAYAWLANDPNGKPAVAQVIATDPTFAGPGVAGIAYAEDDDNTVGVFRYVSAQDTPFVDPIPGDYNLDGKVNAADYVTLRNGDTPYDFQAGYDVWAANFGVGEGAGSGSAVGAVPEPTGLVLMLWTVSHSLIAGRFPRRGK